MKKKAAGIWNVAIRPKLERDNTATEINLEKFRNVLFLTRTINIIERNDAAAFGACTPKKSAVQAECR